MFCHKTKLKKKTIVRKKKPSFYILKFPNGICFKYEVVFVVEIIIRIQNIKGEKIEDDYFVSTSNMMHFYCKKSNDNHIITKCCLKMISFKIIDLKDEGTDIKRKTN